MNESFEAAQAAADYLDVLIRIADKYKINREKFVRDSIMIMVCASASVNYDKYKVEGE